MDENIEKPLQIDTPDETFTSGKRFAQLASDLTDEEIQNAFMVINAAREKYRGLPSTPNNLDRLRDEVEYRLAEVGILAKLDPTPVIEGRPPVIDIIGKVDIGPFAAVEVDHEKKQWQIHEAIKRGEYRYGEKEVMNPQTKAAKKKRTQEANRKKLILPDGE